MLKIENWEVVGWEHAIRGMRNPLNSWDKSDSKWVSGTIEDEDHYIPEHYEVGPNDLKLMKKLAKAGTDHRKFMRYIDVYLDITAPLYWWKEFDTYRAGVVPGGPYPDPMDIEMNSCSTMHKIHSKEFELDDFSYEHLLHEGVVDLGHTIDSLNQSRRVYLYGGELCDRVGNWTHFEPKSKEVWYQMIQLLPSSYNQRRTIKLNYEVDANIYKSRRHHKLDEWHTFCDWIETLPYSELITGKDPNKKPGFKEIMEAYDKQVSEIIAKEDSE